MFVNQGVKIAETNLDHMQFKQKPLSKEYVGKRKTNLRAKAVGNKVEEIIRKRLVAFLENNEKPKKTRT